MLKFLQKKVTEEEQQLFVQHFSMFLQHDQEREFLISLDDVWEWIGFAKKQTAKELLCKHFVVDRFTARREQVQGGITRKQYL